MPTRWTHFEHGSDIGIWGEASTKEEAFEQAALALTAVLTDPTCVKSQEAIHISRTAPDDEMLLLDWPASAEYGSRGIGNRQIDSDDSHFLLLSPRLSWCT
jgi:SHS2 domain-containing protein